MSANHIVTVVTESGMRSHVHCDNCELINCDGIAIRGALPDKDPPPDWVRQARMEGRAEFLSLLLDQDPESFANDHIGDHPIADTGDYGQHWERQKLAELFEVDDASTSYLERIEGAYWSQQARIDDLEREIQQLRVCRDNDRSRMDWLEANKLAIQWGQDNGFRYWPEGDSVVCDKDLRTLIDKAREIEASKATPA